MWLEQIWNEMIVSIVRAIPSTYQHSHNATEKAQSGVDVCSIFFVSSVDKTVFGLAKNFNKWDIGHDSRRETQRCSKDSTVC